jgi:protein-tyrosine phosphatase
MTNQKDQVQPAAGRQLRAGLAAGQSVRTSQTHPLRIDEVKLSNSGGIVGITFCPGKKGDSASGYRWERDLAADLDAIARWRPSAMVTLIEEHEFAMLGVADLGEQVSARGIEWHHLPIVDVQPPGRRFELGWRATGPKVAALLSQGEKVLVHCRGGLGRAGTVAALMLIEAGMTPSEAVRSVRAVRPRAIETQDQFRYVLDWPGRNGTAS